MISNQILQNTIDGLKGITRIDLCIIDVEGKVLAATFPEADKYMEPALAFVESPDNSHLSLSRVDIRRERHWRVITLSSISAMSSQLPCLGV